jgi:uncharacterized protein with GYD domain
MGKRILTQAQFNDLTREEYRTFMDGLKKRVQFKKELEEIGLSIMDVKKTMHSYTVLDLNLLVPDRFKNMNSTNYLSKKYLCN